MIGEVMFATTDDGKRIQVNQDGSWVFCEGPVKDGRVSFRESLWGMSRSEVKETEPDATWNDHENVCYFNSRLTDLDCMAIYVFANDQLCRGKYLITQEFVNESNYISSHDSLKEIFIKKYGAPTSDNEYWLNDLYRDDYQDWGRAVGMGHMSRYVVWKLPETEICLGLSGENYECSLFIEYSSAHYSKIEALMKESSILDII
ncbi:TPA: hypothetical protein SMR42_003441 [Pseudomonas putida]|nr:hypothetical protein [Pseudomonas putida]